MTIRNDFSLVLSELKKVCSNTVSGFFSRVRCSDREFTQDCAKSHFEISYFSFAVSVFVVIKFSCEADFRLSLFFVVRFVAQSHDHLNTGLLSFLMGLVF